MNEFLDKLADLMEEYDVSFEIYQSSWSNPEFEILDKKDRLSVEKESIYFEDIRALKTKEDVTENKS